MSIGHSATRRLDFIQSVHDYAQPDHGDGVQCVAEAVGAEDRGVVPVKDELEGLGPDLVGTIYVLNFVRYKAVRFLRNQDETVDDIAIAILNIVETRQYRRYSYCLGIVTIWPRRYCA